MAWKVKSRQVQWRQVGANVHMLRSQGGATRNRLYDLNVKYALGRRPAFISLKKEHELLSQCAEITTLVTQALLWYAIGTEVSA